MVGARSTVWRRAGRGLTLRSVAVAELVIGLVVVELRFLVQLRRRGRLPGPFGADFSCRAPADPHPAFRLGFSFGFLA